MGRSDLEIRDGDDGSLTLSGHAALTGTSYRVGAFTERLSPGCFTATLRSSPDVTLLVEHRGLPLARTIPSRTMRLAEDARGLRVEADLDPTDPDVAARVPKMRRGDLGEMSFAFRVLGGAAGQSWNADYTQREVHAVDLSGGDVSIVTRGANRQTEASIRNADRGSLEERRSAAMALGDRVIGSSTADGLVLVRAASDCARCGGSRQITIACPTCSPDDDPDDAGRPARKAPPVKQLDLRALRTKLDVEQLRYGPAAHPRPRPKPGSAESYSARLAALKAGRRKRGTR